MIRKNASKRHLALFNIFVYVCCVSTTNRVDANQNQEHQSIVTKHYEIMSEGCDPSFVAKYAELFYPVLEKEFKRNSPEKFKIRLFSSKEEFRKAIDADRLHHDPALAGCYSLSNRTVYLWTFEGTTYGTRSTLLHELVHQFQYDQFSGADLIRSSPYVEGMAEYFSCHTLVGERLEVGVIGSVTSALITEAIEVRKSGERKTFRDLAVESDRVTAGEAWALVAFLKSQYPAEFKAWSTILNCGGDLQQAWDMLLSHLYDLDRRYEWWLEGVQRQIPFDYAWGEWKNTADGYWAEAGGYVPAYAVLRDASRDMKIHSQLTTTSDDGRAGIIFHFKDKDRYMMIVPDKKTKSLQLVSRLPGEFRKFPLTFPNSVKDFNAIQWTIDRREGKIKISADGKLILDWQDVFPERGIGFIVFDGAGSFWMGK